MGTGRPRQRLLRAGGAGSPRCWLAASISAVIGAGAGIGSYAYVSEADGTASHTSPISVTTVPAAQTPVLNGTISAAANKIQPSVVTISVESGRTGDIGTGVVLDKAGHILTNNHVVEAAAAAGHDHGHLPRRDYRQGDRSSAPR